MGSGAGWASTLCRPQIMAALLGSVEGGGGAAAPEDLQAQQVKAQACPILSSWTVLSVHRHVSEPVMEVVELTLEDSIRRLRLKNS